MWNMVKEQEKLLYKTIPYKFGIAVVDLVIYLLQMWMGAMSFWPEFHKKRVNAWPRKLFHG